MFFWNHGRFKCNDINLSGVSLFSIVVVVFIFSANLLYCTSTVKNEKKI